MEAGHRTAHPALGGCIDAARIFTSRLVRIVRWRCLRDEEPLRAERAYDEHVLGVTHAGASVLHAAGRSTLLDPTRVVLHQPGAVYSTTHPFGCGDHGCNVAIRGDVVAEAFARHGLHPERSGMSTAVTLGAPADGLQLRLIVEHSRVQTALEPTQVEGDLLALLDRVAQRLAHERTARARPTRRNTRRARDEAVEATRAILSQRFAEEVQLDELASATSTSPFHLCRIFRRATGLPIHRYLLRLRLLAALERVVEGCPDLTDLALELGFSSHSHLSAAFRRELGASPSEIRSRASQARLAEWRAGLGG